MQHLGCSFSGTGFLFQNYYPRFRGAPSGFFKGCPKGRPFGGFGLRELFVWMAMFQSSSGQKAGCNLWFASTPTLDPGVSILIQPEGRMQQTYSLVISSSACFNPHPARRPDATVHVDVLKSLMKGSVRTVSILIQPEGRMQRRIVDVLK